MSPLAPASVVFAWRAGGASTHGATFTRNSGGWYRNRLGFLAQQADNDIPRLQWYDLDGDGEMETPAMIMEGTTTNEFTQSADLTHGDWSANNLSARTANQAGDPEGNTTLDELVEDGNNGVHTVRQLPTLTADVDYAISCWAIANTRTWFGLRIIDAGATTNRFSASFNLSTGVTGTLSAGGTGAGVRSYMEDWTHVAAGLYRCVAVGSVGNGATSMIAEACILDGDDSFSYTGDNSSSLYAGYAQLEDNTQHVARSYVPTTTATASRAVEDMRFTFKTKADRNLTFYGSWIEGGVVFADDGPDKYMLIGRTTGSGSFHAEVDTLTATDQYRISVNDAAGNWLHSAPGAGSPSLGDTIEARIVLDYDNDRFMGGLSIDGAAEATGGWTACDYGGGVPFNENIVILQGSVTSGTTGPTAPMRWLIGAKGLLSMTEMRRIRTALGSVETA